MCVLRLDHLRRRVKKKPRRGLGVLLSAESINARAMQQTASAEAMKKIWSIGLRLTELLPHSPLLSPRTYGRQHRTRAFISDDPPGVTDPPFCPALASSPCSDRGHRTVPAPSGCTHSTAEWRTEAALIQPLRVGFVDTVKRSCLGQWSLRFGAHNSSDSPTGTPGGGFVGNIARPAPRPDPGGA